MFPSLVEARLEGNRTATRNAERRPAKRLVRRDRSLPFCLEVRYEEEFIAVGKDQVVVPIRIVRRVPS
jgi:hypothetical protein